MVALCWIKEVHKQWCVWIQKRVEVIRGIASPDIWFHVPSTSNPSDISTHSISFDHFDFVHWFHGPLAIKEISFICWDEIGKTWYTWLIWYIQLVMGLVKYLIVIITAHLKNCWGSPVTFWGLKEIFYLSWACNIYICRINYNRIRRK